MAEAAAGQTEKKRYWGQSVKLVRKTTPFLVLNVAVYTAFFLAVVVWLGIFGGLAVFFAPRLEVLAWIFIIIAVVVPAAAMGFARRYVLYLVKGAHVAAVTKLLLADGIPEGKGQVAYGREVVQENFRDVSVLFLFDRLIDGTLRRFSRAFVRFVDFLPLGGQVTQIAKWVGQIVKRSLSYVDEAILSYAIAREEKSIWDSARHGLILYAQAYKPILGTAVRVWLLGRVVFIGALIVLAIPGLAILSVFDAVGFQIAVVVATLLLAHLTVLAVYEPFAVVYTLVTYHGAIEGLTPNVEWDQRLQKVSKEFRQLVGKAQEAGGEPDALDTAPQALPEGTAAVPPQVGTPAPTQSAPAAPQRGLGGVGGAGTGLGGLGGLLGKAATQLLNQNAATPPPAAPDAAESPPDPEPGTGEPDAGEAQS